MPSHRSSRGQPPSRSGLSLPRRTRSREGDRRHVTPAETARDHSRRRGAHQRRDCPRRVQRGQQYRRDGHRVLAGARRGARCLCGRDGDSRWRRGRVGRTPVAQARRRSGDPAIENTVVLLLPFGAFLPAEAIHASGVLAVVALALYLSRFSASLASSTSRPQGRVIWEMIDFLLTGLSFVLVGLQLRSAAAGLLDRPTDALITTAAVCLTVILVRPMWVFATALLSRSVVILFGDGAAMRRGRTTLGRTARPGPSSSSSPRWSAPSFNASRMHRSWTIAWRGGCSRSWTASRYATIVATRRIPNAAGAT